MKLLAAAIIILCMASPVMAGAWDSFMQSYQWMDQTNTNMELRETMRQQRELQKRQIEEMDRQGEVSSSYPNMDQKIAAYIAARPEYRDDWKMSTCLLSLALKVVQETNHVISLDNALMWADDKLKEMIVTEAAKLNAKK